MTDVPDHIGIVACTAEGAALCYRTITEAALANSGSTWIDKHFATTRYLPAAIQVYRRSGKREAADQL